MSSNSNSSVPLSNTSFSSYLRETAGNRFHTHHAVWGIDHALRLGDPLLPGEDVPQFEETDRLNLIDPSIDSHRSSQASIERSACLRQSCIGYEEEVRP